LDDNMNVLLIISQLNLNKQISLHHLFFFIIHYQANMVGKLPHH